MPSILSHCSKWIGRFPWFGPDPCQNLQLGRDHCSWVTRAAGLNDILATSTSPSSVRRRYLQHVKTKTVFNDNSQPNTTVDSP